MAEQDETDWKGAAEEMEGDIGEIERDTKRFASRTDERSQTWDSRQDDQQAPGAQDSDQLVSIDTDEAKRRQAEEEERQRQEEEESSEDEEEEGPPEQSAGDQQDEEDEEDDDEE